MLRYLSLLFSALALLMGASVGQEGQQETPEKRKTPLEAQYERVLRARGEVDKARKDLGASTVDLEKTERAAELLAAEKRLGTEETDFATLATNTDVRAFGSRSDSEVDWQHEVGEIFRPALEEFKGALEQPRAAEQLRSDLEHFKRLESIAMEAVTKLGARIDKGGDPPLVAELHRLLTDWEGKLEDASNKVRVTQHKLAESALNKKSFFGAAADGLKRFIGSRGKNLLMVIGSFFAAFILFRLMGKYFIRWSPWHRRGKKQFYARLAEVVYYASTFIGALLVATLVLYATGDWVLMAIGILFIVGLLLAAKSGLPKFYEQARLLLNLGEVREGERVVVDGVPWKVDSLGIFTTLTNSRLLGGELRLPIRSLSELRSRPFGAKEPWFPTKQGDWVILSDGTRGKVITQTPELVDLVLLGGSHKTFQTADFLAATPNNISGRFRVRTTFGVDYRHQAVCTTEIPEALTAAVHPQLAALIEEENIQNLRVEFSAAGASSLDFEIIADIKGEVADRYDVISRLLQKAAVDACNEHGWTIPFTQITLHQAEPPIAKPSE